MERLRVTSDALASVGYDAASRTLELEFVSGAVYRYFGVPARVHADLLAADSHGSYFNAHVRDAGYRCARIR